MIHGTAFVLQQGDNLMHQVGEICAMTMKPAIKQKGIFFTSELFRKITHAPMQI
jgi:hypothetical protein